MKLLKPIFLAFAIALICLAVSCDKKCEHQYTETVIDATCTEAGSITRVCGECGDTVVESLSATGHSIKSEAVEPDCVNDGYTLNSCHCGYSYQSDFISAFGHDYSTEIIAPDCDSEGYTTYSCKKCDVSYRKDVVKPIGHELSATITHPDCESFGSTEYDCEKCDYSFISDYVAPLGHDIVESKTAPLCEEFGFTSYSCNNCDYSYNSDFVEPLGHTFKSETISVVSCNMNGETKYTCHCGYFYSEIYAPTGHSFAETVIPPTVSDMGYTEYTCECGFDYVGNYRFYSDILEDAYAGSSTVKARGIDISKWNHKVDSSGSFLPIDWVALKDAGIDYVILKIGSTPRDDAGGLEPTFEMDYQGAKAAGIDVGVYYFTYARNVSEIRRDAETLLSWLGDKQFEYPIYLDVEDVPNEDYYPSRIASPILTEMCLTFFSALQKEGYYTGLYVNNEFLFNILQTDNMIDLFEIWYARYPSITDYVWDPEDFETFVWNTQSYGEHLGMWQYSMTGILPGITGKVDLNFAYKDYPAIIKTNGFNGYSANDTFDQNTV